MVSVLCPSYAIGVQLVGHLGIKGNYNRFQDLSIAMSQAGRLLGVKALLGVEESLAGKRVVIEIDGGRSRIRLYNKELSPKGNPKFDTDWREPKLFVIHVLDKDGKVDRKTTLPFYNVTMGDIHVCMGELTRTLIAMGADQTEAVQFLADSLPRNLGGATGIWNNIKSALHNAGIAPKKIIYTLDYYHAVEHLSVMIKMLPNLSGSEQDKLFITLKEDLWVCNNQSTPSYSILVDFTVFLSRFYHYQFYRWIFY